MNDLQQLHQNGNRVCVVGAGIAGLVTAKVMQEDGFDVTLFERSGDIGGVWNPTRVYPGLKANNSRLTYAFSDFPYPDTADEFPTAPQIYAYLRAYVRHFNLEPLLHLSSTVTSISRSSNGDKGRFKVVVQPTAETGATETHLFDFVAICNGVHSEPNLPQIEGQEQFAGLRLHSSQFDDPNIVKGKRVIVVGGAKSALDCATTAAKHGRSVTLAFRAAHWMFPRYLFRVAADKILISRFSELFIPYYRKSRGEAFLHGPGKFLVRFWWAGLNGMVKKVLKIPPLMVPDYGLPRGFEKGGVGGEFYEQLKADHVNMKRGFITSFLAPDRIILDTGEQLEADVIIFATGWRQGVTFLDEELQNCIQKNGNFHLYRHILPPEEPHMGLIGYQSSIACQLSSEIAAHWLSHCFRGHLALPNVPEMEEHIAEVLAWLADVFPSAMEGYFIGPHLAHYIDELLQDMGLRPTRLGNPLQEFFGPLLPTRYAKVGEERRRLAQVVT